MEQPATKRIRRGDVPSLPRILRMEAPSRILRELSPGIPVTLDFAVGRMDMEMINAVVKRKGIQKLKTFTPQVMDAIVLGDDGVGVLRFLLENWDALVPLENMQHVHAYSSPYYQARLLTMERPFPETYQVLEEHSHRFMGYDQLKRILANRMMKLTSEEKYIRVVLNDKLIDEGWKVVAPYCKSVKTVRMLFEHIELLKKRDFPADAQTDLQGSVYNALCDVAVSMYSSALNRGDTEVMSFIANRRWNWIPLTARFRDILFEYEVVRMAIDDNRRAAITQFAQDLKMHAASMAHIFAYLLYLVDDEQLLQTFSDMMQRFPMPRTIMKTKFYERIPDRLFKSFVDSRIEAIPEHRMQEFMDIHVSLSLSIDYVAKRIDGDQAWLITKRQGV